MDINDKTIKSALVSTVLMAVLQGAGYVIALGDIFKVDFHLLVNILVISLLTGAVSIIKNTLTTPAGNFAGVISVK